ncbi:MAG: nuclear transport factor 2 family protein [Pseudomonadota bacterium]
MRSKAEIIHQWYKDIWIGGDLDKVEQMYCPVPDEDALVPGALTSIEETREMVVVLANLVGEMQVRVIHSIEQDDWVSAQLEVSGCKQGTDVPVSLRWLTMVRFEDGRIVESYPSVNFLSFFEQLGQLPADSFELLLSGTVLR